MPTLPFENHDSCGDIHWRFGAVDCQVINTVTNVFFAAAGARIVARAAHTETACNGVLLIVVAWFSSVYHATSSWSGFILDIGAMAAWAAHLLHICQSAAHILGGKFSITSRLPARAGIAAFVGAAAVSAPFVAFEVFDADPVATWNIWANAFLVVIVAAALPSLLQLHAVGMLGDYLSQVAIAIGAILVGVVFTQLIHALCVPGIFTAFPLHSFWHLCASTSAFGTVCIVDDALTVARSGTGEIPSRGASKKSKDLR